MAKKKKEVNVKSEGSATKKLVKKNDTQGLTGATSYPGNPFSLMRSLTEDMEKLFGDFGFESRFPRISLFDESLLGFDEREFETDFSPPLEMIRQNGQIVVRTDLPGIQKEDIDVEVSNGRLTIKGERKNDVKEESDGYFRTERTYGRFLRQLPLPENVDAGEARAVFKDGVLEITMPAPEAVPTNQKVEITEGEAESKAAASGS